jgi:hypothetical protein
MPEDEETKQGEDPKPAADIKRVNIGLHVAAQIALAVLLFVLINYLSFRHHSYRDLTDDQRYTLDERTVQFLQGLDQNIKITMAFGKDARIYPQLSALLDEYKNHSGGRVKVDKFDPGRDKARAIAFRNETSMPIEGNMLILDFGGRRKTISEAQMLGDDGRLFFGEDLITSRIIGATQGGDQKVYLLSSLGGMREVGGRTALDELAVLAGSQFANVGLLSLSDVNEVPYDADAIIILNPESDLEERDVEMLTSYWENDSGSLLVFLNPQKSTPRLDGFLGRLGVTRRDDRVLHAVNSVADARPEFRVQGRFLPGPKITSGGLADTVTTLRGVTSSFDVAVGDQELAQDGLTVTPLMKATERFWGETRYETGGLPVFDPTEDYGQPLYIAATVERGGAKDSAVRLESSRLVAVANGTMLDPDSLTDTSADFVLSSLNWALDREELIGITPKRATTYTIKMSAAQTKRTFWLAVLILPGLVFGAAIFMWFVRRA